MSTIHELPEDERPREKLLARGAAALSDAELLAIFFRVGVPGMSAIQLAQHILDQAGGTLRQLARRDAASLTRIKGIGTAKAAQLSAAFELGRRLAAQHGSTIPIDTPQALYDLLAPQMAHLPHESLRVVLVNTRYRLIRNIEVARGSVNETIAHPREIMHHAIVHQAYAFFLAHNHPSGDPSPSSADRSLTARIAEAAALLQISFLDHLIIGQPSSSHDCAFFSFREHGLL